MFHVEHRIKTWFSDRGFTPDTDKIAKLASYISKIKEAANHFNLTGFKSLEEITDHLVLESLEPLLGLIVPRGTRAFDIGSGAGIPGIPLSIYHEHISFHLIESHDKKATFIKSVIEDLSIPNAVVAHGRAEEIGHNPELRESFDYAFARAFSSTYTTLELSLPLLKTGGYLYIYAHDTFAASNPSPELLAHIESLGAVPLLDENPASINLPDRGYSFLKSSSTPSRYPRRYAVIKRESSRLAL